ncbi:hypothetical protein SAMN05216378_0442 [Paenibacillus catalpae]|uniref:Uncharacterized protein n=1 Tax=Paenibacillus catalpae TaxID=1045775 RepID=A0A1I1TBD9_9BACL|nr:hypothetical protein [Paenibacillus catalpae]SFD55906.1 hypothetical protein SAMN05216378_0442 [Paenibacillus catalpae]
MDKPITPEQLRADVLQLFQDAGYTVPGLLPYIDDLVQENDRLKQELKRLRLAATRGSASPGSMNSRLKDALRE